MHAGFTWAGKHVGDLTVADLTGPEKNALFERVVSILDRARAAAVRTINTQMTVAYWLIGHEIVEEEQRGEARAAYGAQLIEDLSKSLKSRYGRGFSVPNLRNFRQFYLCFCRRAAAFSRNGEPFRPLWFSVSAEQQREYCIQQRFRGAILRRPNWLNARRPPIMFPGSASTTHGRKRRSHPGKTLHAV
jgi:hypothetical protein